MTVSFITEKDLNALKEMRKYCFSVDDASVERSLENRYTPENYIGRFEGDQLAATAEICPYNVFFHRSIVGMGGIAWVTSFPEYRNKGYVRDILQYSLSVMRERKQYLSFLGPFSYEFYRRMGWGLTFRFYEFTVDMRQAPSSKDCHLSPKPYSNCLLQDIADLYQKTQIEYNGPVVRDAKTFEKKLKGNHCYLFYSNTGELKGYMLFNIQEETFKIHELIAWDIGVKKEILSFAGKHSAQAKHIKFNTFDKQDLFLFGEHYPNRYIIRTFMQARVIDVAEILKVMKPITNQSFIISIKIKDALAPWNNHTFVVTVNNNSVSVTVDDDSEPDMTCDIDRFSQMSLGALSAQTAKEACMIDVKPGTDIQVLNNLFCERPLALYDYF